VLRTLDSGRLSTEADVHPPFYGLNL